MSPRQLAVVLARHADSLGADQGPDAAALQRVGGRASRCFQHWRDELIAEATPPLYAVLFAAELPLRVWCTAAALPRFRSAGPAVADAVFGELLDLRCLALQALAADYGLTAKEAASLDRFRRRCERWTDVLIGPLTSRTGKADFAFQPDRARDFADPNPGDVEHDASWPLIVGGLRLTFAAVGNQYQGPGNRVGEAASELAAAMLASIPWSAFDGDGCLMTPGLARAGCVVPESALPRTAPHTVRRPAPSAAEAQSLPAPPRQPSSISFASLRKRRPIE